MVIIENLFCPKKVYFFKAITHDHMELNLVYRDKEKAKEYGINMIIEECKRLGLSKKIEKSNIDMFKELDIVYLPNSPVSIRIKEMIFIK